MMMLAIFAGDDKDVHDAVNFLQLMLLKKTMMTMMMMMTMTM